LHEAGRTGRCRHASEYVRYRAAILTGLS
jgi:hypothetical protein